MSSADTGPGHAMTPRPKGTWKSHVTLAAGLLLCALAFWFELGRAFRGNSLSWAYVFEWPLLGGFGVYMWWKVNRPERPDVRGSDKPTVAPEFEGMLAAWQEHQRDLQSSREPLADEGEARA